MEVKFLTSTMRGLFATKSYKKGEIIRVLKGSISDKPDRLSIEIMPNVHVLDEYGKWVNHSFEPTTVIKDGSIVAHKDNSPGEQITFNYNSSESSMSHPFEVDGRKVCGYKNILKIS